MSLVRPLAWRDLGVIWRLRSKGVCCDSESALTHGSNALQMSLRGYLDRGNGTSTFVWSSNGVRSTAFAQLRKGGNQARVYYISPSGVDIYEHAAIALLDEMAQASGSCGVHNMIAEVDEGGPEFQVMRKAGFAVYARQEIFHLASQPKLAISTLPVREKTVADDPGILSLYLSLVPKIVQQVDPPPSKSSAGYVLTNDNGEVAGYLGVARGPRGVLVRPYLPPEEKDVIKDLVAAFLHLEARRFRNGVYVCVRSYQEWMVAALAESGFDLCGQQAVMVKRLVARIKHSVVKPVHTINRGKVKISSPVVKSVTLAGARVGRE